MARAAGAAYLAIILCGVWAEGVVRGQLRVPGDPQATAAAVAAHPGLFRAGMAADAMMLACDVTVALLFWRLLRAEAPRLAVAAMLLRLVQATTILAGLSFLPGVLAAARAGDGTAALAGFGAHGLIYDAGLAFFAGNCAAMAVLLWRAGGVPRIIAASIGLSAPVYLTGSLAHFLAPVLLPLVQPAYLLPLAAESALALWLLIRARVRRAAPPADPPCPAAGAHRS
ncbi:DUF4386 domain-containing protein [Mangrovicoccus sp. HB161399]|uniref:DUF4386 domain-containing protein n=1 Tax=Mangrovicoccus sp. HB161399 TaxID=2720392 RepID=UPI0015534348|nr:DUF4386 domain-containing protein [Mangrovicoccus sp. HB161399]